MIAVLSVATVVIIATVVFTVARAGNLRRTVRKLDRDLANERYRRIRLELSLWNETCYFEDETQTLLDARRLSRRTISERVAKHCESLRGAYGSRRWSRSGKEQA